MKVGAEPRKMAVLVALLGLSGYLYYSNSRPDNGGTPAPKTVEPAAREQPATARRITRTRNDRGGVREFRPSLKPKTPQDRPDPMTIDPTLRLNLLEKLQQVRGDGVQRSLFEFSKAPPPKQPEPKIIPGKTGKDKQQQKLAAAELAKKTATKPPPPPIKLKFYGYVSPVRSKRKTAFFLDGEDIFVAGEGDLIGKRYKVVRIGVNSAVVEDTQHKHEQTLKLEEQRG